MCFHTNVKYNKILGDTAIKVKCSPTRTIKLFLAEKHFILLQFFNLKYEKSEDREMLVSKSAWHH